MYMNQAMFSGNLTAKPELKDGGKESYALFTLAVQRKYKNKDGVYEADFIPLKVWGKKAESLVKNCDKGDKVSVNAHYHTDSYVNDKGETVYTKDLIADDLDFRYEKTSEQEVTEEINEELEK